MYEAEIAKGIEWLDTVKPDWLDCVDLAKLDMCMPTACVIGQVFGNYAYIEEEIAGDFWDQTIDDWTEQHGFCLPSQAWSTASDWSASVYKDWQVLTDEWVQELTRVRGRG